MPRMNKLTRHTYISNIQLQTIQFIYNLCDSSMRSPAFYIQIIPYKGLELVVGMGIRCSFTVVLIP